jgi:Fur family zinc uptake transcriptional regulator
VVFMICETCGGVDEAGSDAVSDGLNAIAARQGFAAARSVIEMTGRCGHCRT